MEPIPVPRFAQLSKLVTVILALNPSSMTLLGTNCYIVGEGPSRILVDTGSGETAFLSHFRDSMASIPVTSLSAIVITHAHPDHTGGISQVASLFPAPVYSFAPEANQLPLHDGQELFSASGARLTVIHTPGHTPDHISLILAGEDAVFSGDCVLGQGTAVFSDLALYMKSLHRLDGVLKPGARIYPGYTCMYSTLPNCDSHGPVVDNGKDKVQEYIRHRNEREKQILDLMADGNWWTAFKIVSRLYASYPKDLWPAAERGVVLHLEKLVVDGIACRDGERYRILQQDL